MMKAAQYTAFSNNNSDVKIVEVEKPKASPGQAVVRVIAASGNPIDYKVFRGYLEGAWTTPLPFTMGYDFAGIVDEISPEDSAGFAIGDEVFAVNWGVGKHDEDGKPVGGAFAEYVVIPVSRLCYPLQPLTTISSYYYYIVLLLFASVNRLCPLYLFDLTVNL
jgi:NADPH:quinone reductase-like Zn-dependent oxidoreductase